MKTIKPSDELIDAMLNTCSDLIDSGKSKYPGMSYEQGVVEAINWMLGEQEELPVPIK